MCLVGVSWPILRAVLQLASPKRILLMSTVIQASCAAVAVVTSTEHAVVIFLSHFGTRPRWLWLEKVSICDVTATDNEKA